VIDYFLPGNWFLPIMDMTGGHEHSLLPYWFSFGSAVILTALVINSFIKQYRDKMKSKKRSPETPQFTMDVPAMLIGVDGMTCEHCKAKVENGLRDEENITNAIADIEKHTVKLYGSNLDIDRIKQRVHQLGYIFKEIN
jgi:copper chaperone CopZ